MIETLTRPDLKPAGANSPHPAQNSSFPDPFQTRLFRLLDLALDLPRHSPDNITMSMRRIFPYFLFLPVVVTFTGCHRPTPPPMPEAVVQVTPARAENVQLTRTYIGTVDGYQNSKVQARVVGYLQTQNYKEGSVVQKGDVLFQIDPRPFIAALQQAQADMAQAEAKAALAQTTLARQTKLFETNVISAQEFDESTQSARADIAAAKAAAANVENAKLNLEFCTVTAPFTGIAGIANAQIGDLVGTGSNMVLTEMSQLDPVKVFFPISEQEYMGVAEHLLDRSDIPLEQRPANMTLQLANGATFPQKGRFEFANREVAVTTGTILISALFPNPGYILRPGQFAKVEVPTGILNDAVLVPQRAVQQLQTVYQIYVVGADSKVEVRTVQVGERYNTDWVVTSGLKAGESVIVEGIQKAKAGQTIKTTPWQPTASPTPEASPATSPTPGQSN